MHKVGSARTLVLGGAIATAAAALVSAQTPLNVKLGLWEVTSTQHITGMEMPQVPPNVDLSKVPPEQRARIEAMMKANQAKTSGQPTTIKQCVTTEKLNRALFDDREMDPSCKRTMVSSSSTLEEINIECSGRQKMSGTVKIEATGPEAVKGTTHFMADMEGKPITIDSTFAGKWVSADCAGVK